MSDRHAGDLTGLVERVKRAPVRQVLHGHFGQPLWHVVGGPADRQPARARQEPLPASASLLSVTSTITWTASTPPPSSSSRLALVSSHRSRPLARCTDRVSSGAPGRPVTSR
jgi:hypothetical protein